MVGITRQLQKCSTWNNPVSVPSKPKKKRPPNGVDAQNAAAKVLVADKYNFGHPSEYRAEFCNRIIDWFTGDRTERVLKRRVVTPQPDKDGVPQAPHVAEEYYERPTRFPTFEGFAHFVCNVSIMTLKRWRDQHPDFREASARAAQLQKDWLCEIMVKGMGNPAGNIFLARNMTDLRLDAPTPPPVVPPSGRVPIHVNPFGRTLPPERDGVIEVQTNGHSTNGNGNGHAEPVLASP